MSPKTIRIVTRARTMSGKRGGMVLDLPKHDAEAWIERRWADPVPVDDEPKERPQREKTKPRL